MYAELSNVDWGHASPQPCREAQESKSRPASLETLAWRKINRICAKTDTSEIFGTTWRCQVLLGERCGILGLGAVVV